MGAGSVLGGIVGFALGGPVGGLVLGTLGGGVAGTGEVLRRRTVASGGALPTVKNLGGLLPESLTVPVRPDGSTVNLSLSTFDISQRRKPISSKRTLPKSGSSSRSKSNSGNIVSIHRGRFRQTVIYITGGSENYIDKE